MSMQTDVKSAACAAGAATAVTGNRTRLKALTISHTTSGTVSATNGLSVRNITILGKLGITSKQEASEAIKSGRIRPLAFKNYGIKSYSQLVTWLDEQQP